MAQVMSGSVASKTLSCKNLHDYLRTLDPDVLDRLYNHPATCLAVIRELPELARHLVLRILFMDQALFQGGISKWVSQVYKEDMDESCTTLSDLRVWRETMVRGLPGWELNENFKKNLRIAMFGGGDPWTMTSYLEPDPKGRDIPYLDTYALERWECVLHYMVGAQQPDGISADAVRILLHSGLMKSDEEDGSPVITKEGFQFLLMDTASQVWYFILQYLDTVEERKLDMVECLSFLFQLSFSKLGKDYSTDGMSEGLLVFLQHLREFGLVFQRKRKVGRFYPTRLALNIASAQRDQEISVHQPGYIVVETNYRVYAYTNSSLQVALIGLFCQMLYRFPNLCVAIISRESVRQALRSGITADQMISFLRMHAHPQMVRSKEEKGTKSVLPETIVDQIRLWEMERDRFTFTEGVLYNHFLSQTDFETLRNYAQDLGVLVWQKDQKRMMVVTKSGHDEVKRFWKRHSKS